MVMQKPPAKPAPSLDIVYGIHPLTELLRAQRRKLYRLMVATPEPTAWPALQKLLPAYCKVELATRARLTHAAGTDDHQGFVGFAGPLSLQIKPFDPVKQPLVLLLDGIQDSRNLGAILRTAYCTGVDGVILGDRRTAPLNGVVYKASAGLIEHLTLRTVPSSTAAAQELVQAGYTIYCAALPGSDATQVTYQVPCVIVVGNEGTGIVPTIKRLGTSIMLPQRTADISYNASVAAGILLFHIAHQLKKI